MAASFKEIIIEIRTAIRWHRDARGDDRCWLDDYKVWNLIDGTPPIPTGAPPFKEGMEQCRAFYEHRNAQATDPIPSKAILDPTKWDEDLQKMSEAKMLLELMRLQAAIRKHRNIKDRPRTADDDRALYDVLPEKVPADFRLPPEADFLGEAKAPHAGCPSFWRSHAACKAPHDFSSWGPCEKTRGH